MNLPLFIAFRYFRSKKSTNVINIISGISVAGVAIGTAALIIVLSVFNGFETLVISLYNSFDPNLKITAAHGKTFLPDDLPLDKIKNISGIKFLSQTLEDNALLKHGDKQYICTVKGVSKEFPEMTGLAERMTEGDLVLENGDTNYAVAGQGVAYYLSLNTEDAFSSIQVYVPKRGTKVELNPEDAFTRKSIFPAGIFSVQQDFDSKYLLVPLRFARDLFSYDREISALEIGLDDDSKMEKVQEEVSALSGKNFIVKNRFQQHEMLYKIMKSEKWAVYLILTFILLIATFNIIGSLTMLILDKKNDIAILHALGVDSSLAKKIFLFEGSMISVIGAAGGMIFGFVICLLQQKFGFVKLQGTGSFVVDAYPVQLQSLDFVYVFATVIFIGFLAAWYPAGKLTGRLVKARVGE